MKRNSETPRSRWLAVAGLLFVISHLSFNPAGAQSLQQLYDMAEQQSRQISLSQTGLQATDEAVSAAKSALLPAVNISISGSYIGDALLMSRSFSTSGTTQVIVPGLGPQDVDNGRQSAPHWGNSFSLQASQVIYAGGARSSGIRMAELSRQLAQLDVEKNRQEVRFLLTDYYLDLCRLHNQIMVVEQNIGLARRLIDHNKSRYEQGTVLRTDITRYELQLQTLELTRTKLQEAAAIINHQISTTLHLPEGTSIVPDTLALQAEYQGLQTLAQQDFWQQTAAENNIGLRQAAVAGTMANEKAKQAQAASLPTVALVAEDHLFGPYTNDLIPVNANVNAWFVGVGVSYDLSSLWQNRHRVSQARLEARRQEEQLQLASEGINQAVQAAYTHLQTAFTEVETQETQVRLSVENYNVVQDRYMGDLALLTDMLDAANVRLSAEMGLADARIALLYSYYRLKYVTNTL